MCEVCAVNDPHSKKEGHQNANEQCQDWLEHKRTFQGASSHYRDEALTEVSDDAVIRKKWSSYHGFPTTKLHSSQRGL